MTPDDFFEGRALARRKARVFARPPGNAPPAPAAPGSAAAPARAAAPAPPPPEPPAAGPRTLPSAAPASMVDVGAKAVVPREATAEGFLGLRPETVAAIRAGKVGKGDPVAVAHVAAVLAAKNTPQFVPLCHPIPLTGVRAEITVEDRGVRCRVTVKADYKTGVEMEALTAVAAALLAVWDMTKGLEKDAEGQYPETAIEGIRVVGKRKG